MISFSEREEAKSRCFVIQGKEITISHDAQPGRRKKCDPGDAGAQSPVGQAASQLSCFRNKTVIPLRSGEKRRIYDEAVR
jgi:hypothetical protein